MLIICTIPGFAKGIIPASIFGGSLAIEVIHILPALFVVAIILLVLGCSRFLLLLLFLRFFDETRSSLSLLLLAPGVPSL